MKIKDLTHEQKQKYFNKNSYSCLKYDLKWCAENYPEYTFRNFPEVAFKYNPKWVEENEPHWTMNKHPDYMATHNLKMMIYWNPDFIEENYPDLYYNYTRETEIKLED